jgi:hypothetical protein
LSDEFVAIRTHFSWRGASLQTAVVWMRQRQTRRLVLLVGVVHIGLPQYYAQIQALISAHEQAGGVVLYEGLGGLTADEITGLSPPERAIYRTLAPLHDLYRTLARGLGLVFQGEALRYDREHWINADLSLRELVRRWSEAGAPTLPLSLAGAGEVAFPRGWVGEATGATMLLLTPALLRVMSGLSARIPTIGRLRELLLSDRNRTALDAMEAATPNRDVIILYGAAHLTGLMQGLARRGFTADTAAWYTAYARRAPWASNSASP